jgi:hypothetical protein
MDVHVPRAVTTALRLRSINVLTAQEDGAAQMDDDELLKRATELGRILVSQDKDLLREGARLLREGGTFSGIVYAHQLRVTIGQIIEDLVLIAVATSLEEWHGKLSIYRSAEKCFRALSPSDMPRSGAHITQGSETQYAGPGEGHVKSMGRSYLKIPFLFPSAISRS